MAELKVKLMAHTPNPDAIVAAAAKLCYSPVGVDGIMEKLTDEEVAKFVEHLVSMGHESPIEHVTFTFGIEGISRSCSHQIVRHRIASFSQQSQRYVKLDQFEYIIPPEIAKDSYTKGIFIKHMEESQDAYDKLVDALIDNKIENRYPTWFEDTEEEYMALDNQKLLNLNQNIRNLWAKNHKKEYNAIEKEAIEDARYVFPNACETKMVTTMNARSLYNLFNKRCCNRAQWEIRQVADEMLKLVKEVAPVLFKNAGAPCTVTGKCPEGSMSCKNPRK
jgi:thymidylate synthase (FAD)